MDININGIKTNIQECSSVCRLSQASISNTSSIRCKLVVITMALYCTKLSPSNLKEIGTNKRDNHPRLQKKQKTTTTPQQQHHTHKKGTGQHYLSKTFLWSKWMENIFIFKLSSWQLFWRSPISTPFLFISRNAMCTSYKNVLLYQQPSFILVLVI